MTLFLISEVSNMGDILFFPLNAIDTCCKRIIGATLSLPATTPRIFLVIMVLFIGLALMDKTLLEMFSTKHVSIKKVNRFILPSVLVLFLGWLVLLETLSINLSSA